jgi:hypothetical protein
MDGKKRQRKSDNGAETATGLGERRSRRDIKLERG